MANPVLSEIHPASIRQRSTVTLVLVGNNFDDGCSAVIDGTRSRMLPARSDTLYRAGTPCVRTATMGVQRSTTIAPNAPLEASRLDVKTISSLGPIRAGREPLGSTP
jgi:hypothetical protein